LKNNILIINNLFISIKEEYLNLQRCKAILLVHLAKLFHPNF